MACQSQRFNIPMDTGYKGACLSNAYNTLSSKFLPVACCCLTAGKLSCVEIQSTCEVRSVLCNVYVQSRLGDASFKEE